MKVRAGFVSNSSSTSFLIVTKEELTKDKFLDLMGLKPDSPLLHLFNGLYEAVIESVEDKIDFANDQRQPKDWYSSFRKGVSEKMEEKILEAQQKKAKVYYGMLSSESTPIEAFFCMDSFEVENEDVYFNSLQCMW